MFKKWVERVNDKEIEITNDDSLKNKTREGRKKKKTQEIVIQFLYIFIIHQLNIDFLNNIFLFLALLYN